jgi:hypothetical protein
VFDRLKKIKNEKNKVDPMTTQVEFGEAFTHLFAYCFQSINDHITEQSKSKKTPFSLYMKEKHKELKVDIPDISKRSTSISNLWKAEPKNVVDAYKKLAENYVPEENNQKKKRAGGLNCFQMYCKFERDGFVKKNKDDKKQSTRDLSVSWKLVTKEKKDEYKVASEKYNKAKKDAKENKNDADMKMYKELTKQFVNPKPEKNSNKKNKKNSKKVPT